mmetsp:Transcript_18957/g.34332  ORF Transcript_18957/g.34332 Transcript_18957/m.34332 type:complete len:398 (+) Transcript_18957:146-1339(+)|eukprot:CAMPEP_0204911280 /NCGR_PEP_ID=MMETSP1397-20131031/9658_1 /ASSEMBLY_ACC=CAM_ASM_000891 /TAXON_ID=49980 /ORGANISM="Climacostomum Climacostomum virens, Strain Stock W-24" /LENGTH=397 /DNA_ID=CAMNT_0052081783 /DNA_START=47 /DNA_END=1240 /DNA_ORIENTATION=-
MSVLGLLTLARFALGIYTDYYIDELTCNADTLLSVNQGIAPLLQELKKKLFFKIFKLSLDNECPFWAHNYFCELASCAVCECSKDEIPVPWLEEATSQLDLTIYDHFADWKAGQSWTKADSPDTYVNLMLNSEAYTNYQGQHIWAAIYNENCFTSPVCTEERFFYQLVSGLHTNINSHISYNYIPPSHNFVTYEDAMKHSFPNVTMFYDRVGNYPERIKNFYFAFAVLLRAANKAADFISSYEIHTGNKQEDIEAREILWQVLNITTQHCSLPFDEQQLFVEPSSWALKEQIKNNFYNISRIIDCVGCEKCRLHGKLQITGLGAAMKILFDTEPALTRNELIGLFNTLAKFSRASNIMIEMEGFKVSGELLLGSILMAAACIVICVSSRLARLVKVR